jgi:hypothetical protein
MELAGLEPATSGCDPFLPAAQNRMTEPFFAHRAAPTPSPTFGGSFATRATPSDSSTASRPALHGKEKVDGSSPSDGSAKASQTGTLFNGA